MKSDGTGRGDWIECSSDQTALTLSVQKIGRRCTRPILNHSAKVSVMAICARCGVKLGFASLLTTDLGAESSYCTKCADKNAEESREAEKQRRVIEKQRIEQLTALSKRIVVTTTPNIDGYRVKKYLGVESVEFVIGTGVFSEVSSSIADFFGARSSAFETKLRAAKQHAMDALKFLAAEKGANAVVAVDLDYTEFSGNRIALIINGTLVAVEPIPK